MHLCIAKVQKKLFKIEFPLAAKRGCAYNLELENQMDVSMEKTTRIFRANKEKKIAHSFLNQGENRLLIGDPSGIQLFDLSFRLDPTNAELLYAQGVALLEFGEDKGEEKALLLAAKRFKLATKLKEQYFEALQAWGHTLFVLGLLTREHHYFIAAEKTLAQAITLAAKKPKDLLADLYWDYGRVWFEIAAKSAEISDLTISLNAFGKAKEMLSDLPADFWLDYGHSALALGQRINDLTVLETAISYYKNGVSIAISSFSGWLYLANAFACIYDLTHDENHFLQASDCYTTAAKLNEQDPELYLQWAKLLLSGGILTRDVKRLRTAVEKCVKAESLTNVPEEVLGIAPVWAQAMAKLGLLTERVELINEARWKLEKLLDDSDIHPDLWLAYGHTFYALGKYFHDLDYTYQAIEKFQEGLSIDRTQYKLWHALGKAYTMCALIEQEPKTFELAHRFLRKALSLSTSTAYLYDTAYCLFKAGELARDQQTLESAIALFEQAIGKQKNAFYFHPDWLFAYASALGLVGELSGESQYFTTAIEILNHVLMVDPEFPDIHYTLGLIYNHAGDDTGNADLFRRAIHHFRCAMAQDEENDQLLLDWAITLVNFSQHLFDPQEQEALIAEAELKMILSAKLGAAGAYYQLACLCSLKGECDRSLQLLEKANVFDGLPTLSEIFDDEWLDNIRETEGFRLFLEKLETKNPSKN